MRDLCNNIYAWLAIAPVVVSDNTATVGAIIDRKGFDSVTYVLATGTLADADATFAVLLQEGDESDLSDAAAVDDADLLGTEAAAGFAFDDDGETRKLGYIGSKRYTRLTITPTGNADAAPIAAVAILGHRTSRRSDPVSGALPFEAHQAGPIATSRLPALRTSIGRGQGGKARREGRP